MENNKEHLNLVFIGHVDHGKSTLCGEILRATGKISARALEKLKEDAIKRNRSSWYLSMMMDLIEEEKDKGKTIEVGKAFFNYGRKRYTIFDCPGHEKYITNMIEGASKADVGILVISARKGEFEDGFKKDNSKIGGQTKEHIILAKTMGVKKLIVVVNKMDDITVNWSKNRFDEVVQYANVFLKKIGFSKNTFIPISAINGDNIKNRKDDCAWYEGSSLLETLEHLRDIHRDIDSPLYASVIDCYQNQKGDAIVVCKIDSGKIFKNQKLLVKPINANVKVLKINNDWEENVDEAFPGDNVLLTFKKTNIFVRNQILVSEDSKMKETNNFIGQVKVLNLPKRNSILTAGFSCVFHFQGFTVECNVEKVLAKIDRKTKKRKKEQIIRVGDIADLYFSLSESLYLTNTSKFTLRSCDETIGFGRVLKLTEQNN